MDEEYVRNQQKKFAAHQDAINRREEEEREKIRKAKEEREEKERKAREELNAEQEQLKLMAAILEGRKKETQSEKEQARILKEKLQKEEIRRQREEGQIQKEQGRGSLEKILQEQQKLQDLRRQELKKEYPNYTPVNHNNIPISNHNNNMETPQSDYVRPPIASQRIGPDGNPVCLTGHPSEQQLYYQDDEDALNMAIAMSIAEAEKYKKQD